MFGAFAARGVCQANVSSTLLTMRVEQLDVDEDPPVLHYSFPKHGKP